jgi:hypothetical protein
MAAGDSFVNNIFPKILNSSQRLFDFSFTTMTLPKIKKVFSKEFSPGISSITPLDKVSLVAYLAPMIRHAKIVLDDHQAQWRSIPIYLRTTGV